MYHVSKAFWRQLTFWRKAIHNENEIRCIADLSVRERSSTAVNPSRDRSIIDAKVIVDELSLELASDN